MKTTSHPGLPRKLFTSPDTSSRALERQLMEAAETRRSELTRTQQSTEAEMKGLFSAREHRQIAKLSLAARQKWHRENAAAVDGFASASDRHLAIQRQLQQQLRREIPNYAKYRAVQRAVVKRHRLIENDSISHLPLQLGQLRQEPGDDAVAITSKVSSFSDPDRRVYDDNSFCKPAIRQFAHNFSYEHNEDGWWVGNDLLSTADYSIFLGGRYQLPRTGNHFRVKAEIENVANRATLAAGDNFGISSGSVGISIALVVKIMNGTRHIGGAGAQKYAKAFPVSGGTSLNVTNLDGSLPYNIAFTWGGPVVHEAGETWSVYVGTRIHIESLLDDLHLYGRFTYWWRLNKLTIAVV